MRSVSVVVVVRGVAFTWTGVHAQTLLQPLVVQSGLTVGAPLPQTHGFVFELWSGTLGASARASLGLLGSVDRSSVSVAAYGGANSWTKEDKTVWRVRERL